MLSTNKTFFSKRVWYFSGKDKTLFCTFPTCISSKAFRKWMNMKMCASLQLNQLNRSKLPNFVLNCAYCVNTKVFKYWKGILWSANLNSIVIKIKMLFQLFHVLKKIVVRKHHYRTYAKYILDVVLHVVSLKNINLLCSLLVCCPSPYKCLRQMQALMGQF